MKMKTQKEYLDMLDDGEELYCPCCGRQLREKMEIEFHHFPAKKGMGPDVIPLCISCHKVVHKGQTPTDIILLCVSKTKLEEVSPKNLKKLWYAAMIQMLKSTWLCSIYEEDIKNLKEQKK